MNDKPKKPVSPAYVGDVNRILKSVDTRAALLGRTASVREIGDQVAIRSVSLNISSARRELTAIRTLCRSFMEGNGWPEGLLETKLSRSLTPDQIEQLMTHSLLLPVSELIEIGAGLIAEQTDLLIRSGYPGSREDLAQILSGVFPNRARGVNEDRAATVPITEGDLSRIDFPIMDHPYERGVETLGAERTDVIALSRIFMRVIWLTGMRPVEVFDCKLLCGDPTRDYSLSQLALIRTNPEQAALSGLLIPQEALVGAEELGHSRAVLNTVKETQISPILVIKNAKTRNANKNLVRTYRVQVLDRIGDEELHLISLAARLHKTQVPEGRRKDLISMISRRIRSVAEEELPEREGKINLYALRHDFATRARKVMPMYQVAALMGHTSKSSTQGYGKTRTRRSASGSGSGGWVPKCDETVASKLHAAFGADSGPDQAPVSEAPTAPEPRPA